MMKNSQTLRVLSAETSEVIPAKKKSRIPVIDFSLFLFYSFNNIISALLDQPVIKILKSHEV